MSLISLKKKLAILALGGSSFAFIIGGEGGCSAVLGDILEGLGNGAIGAGTEAVFGGLPDDVQGFAQQPVEDGLTNAWSNYIDVTFPVVVVRRQLFQE